MSVCNIEEMLWARTHARKVNESLPEGDISVRILRREDELVDLIPTQVMGQMHKQGIERYFGLNRYTENIFFCTTGSVVVQHDATV